MIDLIQNMSMVVHLIGLIFIGLVGICAIGAILLGVFIALREFFEELRR